MSNETYKDGDTLDGTQEGPVVHGSEGGASGTVRVVEVTSAGAANAYITNATIQETTSEDATGENIVVAGVTTDTTAQVQPFTFNASGAVYTVGYEALVPDRYDQLSLGYDGSTLTSVVYLYSAATLTTLTLAYDGDNLTSVVKT